MQRTRNVTYPSLTHADTPKEITVWIAFPFRHLNHSFMIAVSRILYEVSRSSWKEAWVPAGIGDAWLVGYYAAFTSDPVLVPFYRVLLAELRKIRSSQNYDDDTYIELITVFVQSIQYDTEKVA